MLELDSKQYIVRQIFTLGDYNFSGIGIDVFRSFTTVKREAIINTVEGLTINVEENVNRVLERQNNINCSLTCV